MQYLWLAVIGLLGHFLYGMTHKGRRPNIKYKSWFGNSFADFGGDSKVSDIKIPEFKPDEFYQKSQNLLFPLGSDLLKGIIPEYYADIGKAGGTDFEKMLDLTTRDITTSVNEGLAKRNLGRGGLGLSIASKAVADATTKLRWSDFQRAIAGKEGLLTTGLNTMAGVRSGALSNQGQTNEFSLGATKLSLEQAQYEDEQAAQENAMWGQLLKAGISAAATIATGGAAAPVVAAGYMGSAAPTAGMGLNSWNASTIDFSRFG
jgi:hypothetical protein